jgi:glycosyltransferase involved in cell wall biosynthesis
MPDVEFMGVEGGYDSQIKDTSIHNIKYVPNTPHIQELYEQTRILLVPSAEESWGRVAVEAMSSGIPVLANPTPGLREACGQAGIFVERENIAQWVNEIRKLLTDKHYYKKTSDTCFRRAQELYPEKQLKNLAVWLEDIEWTDEQ